MLKPYPLSYKDIGTYYIFFTDFQGNWISGRFMGMDESFNWLMIERTDTPTDGPDGKMIYLIKDAIKYFYPVKYD